MDGKALLRRLRELLNEASDSEFIDDRTSYEYLYQAAIEFVDRTNCLTSTQTITTVADQSGYTLNADYMGLYLKDRNNNYYIKYNDGSEDQFLLFKEKEDLIYQNSTASVTVPHSWYIEDDPNIDSSSTGANVTTDAGLGGQSTLSSTGSFEDVSAGDVVHNLTDSSDGMVVSRTSDDSIETALFDGSNNYWTAADTFIIQPQGRFRIVLSPPPSTSAHQITFYYVQRPAPVFTSYGAYRFQPQHLQAILYYAAWLYKYRDRAPGFGDKYYQFFEQQVAKSRISIHGSLNQRGWKMNLKARR